MHLADTSQEGGVSPQHRDEPAEEHHLGAVPVEQIPGDLEVPLIDWVHPAPPAGPDRHAVVLDGPEQAVAAFVPDPVADVVADDRSDGRDHEDQPRGEPLRVPGVDGGRDERRLAWQRQTEALGPDHEKHGQVAERGNQLADTHC